MTNRYITAANEKLDEIVDNVSGNLEAMLAAAQADATLAVAAEQARTADALETSNLIAYLNLAATYRTAYPIPEGVLKSVQADVETRLGLA